MAFSLHQQHGQVELKIMDDGIGFDVSTGLDSGGLGLKSMQERASELGANLHINSKPGKGTTIEVVLEVD